MLVESVILQLIILMNLPGKGNSILRSIRPGRIRAGSSDSILFVAITTLTSPLKMSDKKKH